MRPVLALALIALPLAGCQTTSLPDAPEQGVSAVNVPVVARTDYVFDAAAGEGFLAPQEVSRLDAWFRSLGLGYGDSIYVDGASSDAARADVQRLAGQYGLLVRPGAPVTAGSPPPGSVRVVVSRMQASVPGCPRWDEPSQPSFNNRLMPGFGCAVNGNLAAMVANPQDLVLGQAAISGGDGFEGAKAIRMYRDWPLTGVVDGQSRRSLNSEATSEDK